MIQLSVFLKDKPGQLASFIKLLMKNKIYIRALTVAKTNDYGLLLLLVDKPEECVNLLERNNFVLSTTQVIAVKLNDFPNALYDIPKILGDNKINIDYCYSTLVKDNTMLILRVEDNSIEQAIETLGNRGFILI